MKKLFALLLVVTIISVSAQKSIPILYTEGTSQKDLEMPSQEMSIPVFSWRAPQQEVTLPPSIDHSTEKYFPPIISQIGGSCAQASMVGYVFSYEMNRLLDRDAQWPQNRFSYLYSWNFINDGKNQGSLGFDAIETAYHNGLMTEADFPTQTSAYSFYWASGYEKYLRAMHYRIQSFTNMEISSDNDIQTLKRYLYDGGIAGGSGKVVSFSSGASGWQFDDDYQGANLTGYHSLLTSLPTGGSHAMTIAGYDDSIECIVNESACRGAFIVVNSHGISRHDRGRYYLPYAFFTQEKGEQYLLSESVTGLQVAYIEPSIVFKVGLRYSSRNDLYFRMGVADKPYSERAKKEHLVSIACHQGGDYPMQGAYASSEIEFGFNASSLAEFTSSLKEPKFFLTVNRGGIGKTKGEGVMKSFAVYDYRGDREHPKIYQASISNDTLQVGDNLYSIATTPLHTTSASNIDWLRLGQPIRSPFVLRTASGNYAKLKIIEYNQTEGRLTIQYVYAPDGGTYLGE